jgi:hypothetical protein
MRRVACLAFGLILVGGGAAAHHAIGSVYDTSQSLRIKGTITVFRFVDPHPTAALEVQGEAGPEIWQIEMDNRREMARAGMTPESLQPGDAVVVAGSPARIAPRTLYVRRLDRPAAGFWSEQAGRSPEIGFLD